MHRDTNILELIDLAPFGSFPTGSARKPHLPVRRLHPVSSNAHGEGGGAVYNVGSKHYFVGSGYSAAGGKDVDRLDYYLDEVREIFGTPSSQWQEQPTHTPPVTDTAILDAIEEFLIDSSYTMLGRGIYIHRDHQIYEVTPEGVAQFSLSHYDFG